jgi:hypothetical protein
LFWRVEREEEGSPDQHQTEQKKQQNKIEEEE